MPVPSPAELSSLVTALDDLGKRLTVLADDCAAEGERGASCATNLYEVERAVRSATRRLGRLVDSGY